MTTPKWLRQRNPGVKFGPIDTRPGSNNPSYVNPFVRGLQSPARLRISSTVGGQRPVTRTVGKPAPVASSFDWIASPTATVFVNSPETLGARLAGRCDRPVLVPKLKPR